MAALICQEPRKYTLQSRNRPKVHQVQHSKAVYEFSEHVYKEAGGVTDAMKRLREALLNNRKKLGL